MKKIRIAMGMFALSSILLSGCGDVTVTQDVQTVDVNADKDKLKWEEFISITDADKYTVTVNTEDVDLTKLGDVKVIYTITKNGANKGVDKEFTFSVVDEKAPVIHLTDKSIILLQDETYNPNDYYTVEDNYDSQEEISIEIDSNVNAATVGNYYIKYIAKDSSGNESTETINVKVEERKVVLAQKQAIDIPNLCSFYVDYYKISKRVLPPSPASYYSYYDADNGKKYVDVCIAYKNNRNDDIRADDALSMSLNYGNLYNFTGFSIIEEDNRGDFTYSNITDIAPLTKEYIHYLFSIPDEVADGTGSLVATISIGGTDYQYVVRNGENLAPQDKKQSAEKSDSQSNTNGAINTKQNVVREGKSEFYIDYANITNDVKPPSPSNYYSHYRADDGKAYVDVCFAYKNLRGDAIGADSIVSGKLIFQDKYEYTGFVIIEEENRGDFTYANISDIAPLTKEYLHYLCEIPEIVKNEQGSLVFKFTIDGGSYSYTIR